MLTKGELALVEDVRVNSKVTVPVDTRTKSQLRREQRRLLAIIDRLMKAPCDCEWRP